MRNQPPPKSLHKLPFGKFTNFTFASEKHRRLHWTAEEEEMPKEGVDEFSTKIIKNLSWKKVLEFGCRVFILLVLHLISRINGGTLRPKSPQQSAEGNLAMYDSRCRS